MAQKNEKVYEMAQEWIRWLDTKRFYAPVEKKNILARLQPSHSKGEPDGRLDPELNAFNLAVVSLDDGEFIPFIRVYCDYKPKPVKAMAHDLGIGRDQFYERAHNAASKALKTTRRILECSVSSVG